MSTLYYCETRQPRERNLIFGQLQTSILYLCSKKLVKIVPQKSWLMLSQANTENILFAQENNWCSTEAWNYINFPPVWKWLFQNQHSLSSSAGILIYCVNIFISSIGLHLIHYPENVSKCSDRDIFETFLGHLLLLGVGNLYLWRHWWSEYSKKFWITIGHAHWRKSCGYHKQSRWVLDNAVINFMSYSKSSHNTILGFTEKFVLWRTVSKLILKIT